MFQPKLRTFLATTALVSTLTLIPVRSLNAQPRPRSEPKSRDVAARIAPLSFWSFLAEFFQKQSVRIDPNGQPAQTTVPDDESGANKAPAGGGL